MDGWRPSPQQAQVIGHSGGPLRIQAGAGSGKTTTLVRRIAALVAAGRCRPGEVLMLTFTNKAVADMRATVAAVLGGSDLPRVETYHAFALALVREFAHVLGLPPDPVLLTEGPARLFCRLHLDRLGVQGRDLTKLGTGVGDLLAFFAWHRHEGLSRQVEADLLQRLGDDDDPEMLRELLAAHAAYRALLKEKDAADYDDLIALAVELLESDATVRAAVHARYRHVLVDEYQDTDFLQGRFVQRRHAEGVAWRDMAILVRWNKHKLPLYTALLAAGIPALAVGGLDLFADPEAMRLVSYLRALAAPERAGDLLVALGLPRYGLTDNDCAALARQRPRGAPLLTAVTAQAAADPRLGGFLDEFWPLYELQFTGGCLAAMRQAIDLHAGSVSLRARLAAEQVLPLAEGFLAHPELFEATAGRTPLALFCEYLEGLAEAGDPPGGEPIDEETDAVRLMTVHAAKGLEWAVVFLPRLTERDFHPKGGKWKHPFPLAWHHDPDFAADYAAMMAEEEPHGPAGNPRPARAGLALRRGRARQDRGGRIDPARVHPAWPGQEDSHSGAAGIGGAVARRDAGEVQSGFHRLRFTGVSEHAGPLAQPGPDHRIDSHRQDQGAAGGDRSGQV